MKQIIGGVIMLLISVNVVFAQLSMPSIFTDGMVLQRSKPIHFWGKGMPGNTVEIVFANKVKKTIVKNDSTWSLIFKKQKANSVPQSIQITSGEDNITLSNILIGDLWLCIGQSNMEWPMAKEKHFKEEIKLAKQSLLRFYNATYAGKGFYNQTFPDSILQMLQEKDFYKGYWAVSDSNSIKQMSAVGYYFGKEIVKNENIPVGLINLSIGGCPIETFISLDVLKQNSQFAPKTSGNWLNNNALPVWIRERGTQNVGNIAVRYADELGPNHPFKPGFAYAAGIEPLVQMPIKGAIWYQGESNAQELERVREYGDLQTLMVDDYRTKWKQPKMPFYWVQLSSIDTANYKSQYWPAFRDEQRKLLAKIKYGGMVVSSDIGAKDNVHPTNKKDIGQRLARWALNDSYKKRMVVSGPLPQKAIYKNGTIVINFNHIGEGLQTSGNESLGGFSLDGKKEVHAAVKGTTVEIISKHKPSYIFYGWQPYSQGNLINTEGLPTSTFKIKVNSKNP